MYVFPCWYKLFVLCNPRQAYSLVRNYASWFGLTFLYDFRMWVRIAESGGSYIRRFSYTSFLFSRSYNVCSISIGAQYLCVPVCRHTHLHMVTNPGAVAQTLVGHSVQAPSTAFISLKRQYPSCPQWIPPNSCLCLYATIHIVWAGTNPLIQKEHSRCIFSGRRRVSSLCVEHMQRLHNLRDKNVSTPRLMKQSLQAQNVLNHCGVTLWTTSPIVQVLPP